MANPLTNESAFRLGLALAKEVLANEIIDAINLGQASAAQEQFPTPTIIVATSVSTTTNFGALKVGDQILILPAVAGNAQFVTCAVAGTLPQAAVVGSLYVVLRAFAPPAASAKAFTGWPANP